MAIFNESSLGAGLTGGLGDMYIRNQNGKKILCKKPAPSSKPKSDETIKRRDYMRRIMNISKVVTKDPFFHPLWKNSDLKGPAGYHKFNGFNFRKGIDFNIENIKIAPVPPQISLEVKKSSYSNKNFNISIHLPGIDSGINFQRELFLSAGGFVILSNGKAEEGSKIKALPLIRTTKPAASDSDFDFELKSMIQDESDFNDYTNQTFLILFSSLNSEEQPVKHSKTFVFRF